MGGIWRPTKVRDGYSLFHPPTLPERFFESGEDVRTRAVERETGDVDGAGGGKVNAFDRCARPKLDDVPRRDFVADHVELFVVQAAGPEDLMNLVHMILGGGEET